jgi:hypothetical protein
MLASNLAQNSDIVPDADLSYLFIPEMQSTAVTKPGINYSKLPILRKEA